MSRPEPEYLTLQHPHVHEWKYRATSRLYHGPIDEHGPTVYCDCGAGGGSWENYPVYIEVSANLDMTVGDLWPDGDWPVPVTAEAVKAKLLKDGRSVYYLDHEATVSVGREHVTFGWYG